MRKTLADAKNSTIPGALGIAACSADFLTLLNEAQSRLADMGKWWGTYKRMRICGTQNCIIWPREVKTVEGLNVCSYSVPIQNMWYEFQEDVYSPKVGCEGEVVCGETMLLDRGNVPQSRLFSANSYIKLVPASSTDDNKRILLQGTDPNGNPIRSQDGADWVWGEYVVLASPFAQSVNAFAPQALTGAQKPVTDDVIRVYAVNVLTAVETLIATWEPSETNPCYRRTYLTSLPQQCDTSDCTSGCADNGDGCETALTDCTNITLEAIVRLQFIPALTDTDWLFISNLQALKHMMKAIQKEDKNLYQEAEREVQLALRALRNELEAYSPDDRTVINLQFMNPGLRRTFGGFI